MRSYEEILVEVDFDGVMTHPAINRKYSYYVYQQGKCVGTMDTVAEAQEVFGKAVVTERFEINAEAIVALRDKQIAVQAAAIDVWSRELREEYPVLDDLLFNACYDEAYDRGHSAGWDNVADRMHGVVEFACKILNLSRGV